MGVLSCACIIYILTTYCVTFVMLLVVNIKTKFLYDMMPCSLANRYMISHLTGSNLSSTFLFSVIFVMFSIIIGPGTHPASYMMCPRSFSGVKLPGRGIDHPPPSSAKVKERVELYLYFPSGFLQPVLG